MIRSIIFVIQSGEAIVDYEGMVEIVLTMIKKGYCFTVDLDTVEMQWNADLYVVKSFG